VREVVSYTGASGFSISDGVVKGGEGTTELAQLAIDIIEKEGDTQPKFIYDLEEPIKDKIEKIARIIVFGSYVRGDFTEESDIDVLIIGDITLEEVIDISYPVMLKYGVYISPKVKAPKDFDAQKDYSFLKNVISEGIAV
ncbi:MAG: formate--tetrahydrofolate ligase, partial [Candidatus Hydrothermarchaeaceae archaeon]